MNEKTVPQLRSLLRKRGLSVSGSKSTLISRLGSEGNRRKEGAAAAVVPDAPMDAMMSVKRQHIQKQQREILERDVTPRRNDRIKGKMILSWNVNGLRAVLRRKDGLMAIETLIKRECPEILCLQETKLNPENEADAEVSLSTVLPGYKAFWSSSTAKKVRSLYKLFHHFFWDVTDIKAKGIQWGGNAHLTGASTERGQSISRDWLSSRRS